MISNKTAIVLGDSPIIQEYENYIPSLLSLYYSIGINRIIKKFTPSIHTFLDTKIIPLVNEDAYKNIPVVTLKKYEKEIREDKPKELIDAFTNKTDYYKGLQEIEIVKDNKLAWSGFTHDYAISYLYFKGYTNIVLIGAADFIEGYHYSNPEKFTGAQKLQFHSTQFINEVCSRINVFTLNPNPVHNAKPILLEELLNMLLE